MTTFHIPAHAGRGEHDYAWAYSDQWQRTVDAIDRHTIRSSGMAVCTDAADAFVAAGGYVVQEISEEQYAALPARLRRRLDSVRA